MTSTRLAERLCRTQPRPPLRGDEGDLYRRHHRALVGRTRRAVQAPEALIEDACQLAWLQLLLYQPEPRENVLAWLTVVARHEAYRLARDSKRSLPASSVTVTDEEGNTTELDPDFAPGPDRDPLLGHDAREALAALAELKPAQRTALALKVAGYKYKEIQELCGGKTYTWVNRHITEGRAALRASYAVNHGCLSRHVDEQEGHIDG